MFGKKIQAQCSFPRANVKFERIGVLLDSRARTRYPFSIQT